MKKQARVSLNVVLVLVLLAAWGGMGCADNQASAEEVVAIIRENCGGYSNCYNTLAAWEADYGGINFEDNPQGDLVTADKIAVARIEGTWTQADTAPLSLSGWTTDAEHYIRIYTTMARRAAATGWWRRAVGLSPATWPTLGLRVWRYAACTAAARSMPAPAPVWMVTFA